MITIDKSQAFQNLIVTVSENNTSANPEYLLILHNNFSGVGYQIDLGENLSTEQQRYDQFHIASGVTQSLQAGSYKYVIMETTNTQLVEQGMARVIVNSLTEDEIIQVENPSIDIPDEDTISFNPDNL